MSATHALSVVLFLAAGVDRLVLIARLKPGGRDRALGLIAQHQAGQYVSTDFERLAIFLAEGEIVF